MEAKQEILVASRDDAGVMDSCSSISRVSVIIVNYNAGRQLTECVRAVLPEANEVIVVDNASSDSSVDDCLREFAGIQKIRVICNDVNLGFSAACNIGAHVANSTYLLFLNPDCLLAPDALPQLLDVLDTHADTGMVGGLLMNPDGTEQGGGRRAVPTPWRTFVRVFGLSRFEHRWPKLFFDFHMHKKPLPVQPVEVEAISGACMLVRRKLFMELGQFDEGYFMHCEDLDWCMRVRQRDWKILFTPDAKITHSKGVCSQGRPIFVEWHKHKGMVRFYRKFFRHQYPGVLMWLVYVGVWGRFCVLSLCHLSKRLAFWSR